jgi:hypothetical protein
VERRRLYKASPQITFAIPIPNVAMVLLASFVKRVHVQNQRLIAIALAISSLLSLTISGATLGSWACRAGWMPPTMPCLPQAAEAVEFFAVRRTGDAATVAGRLTKHAHPTALDPTEQGVLRHAQFRGQVDDQPFVRAEDFLLGGTSRNGKNRTLRPFDAGVATARNWLVITHSTTES